LVLAAPESVHDNDTGGLRVTPGYRQRVRGVGAAIAASSSEVTV